MTEPAGTEPLPIPLGREPGNDPAPASAPALALYRRLPSGWGVSQAVQEQAEHAVRWLEGVLDWDMGDVAVRWFDAAGPLARADDAGVFAGSPDCAGRVFPDDPRTVWLHRTRATATRARLVRAAVHEGTHVGELALGLLGRLTVPQLEALTDGLLEDFAPALSTVTTDRMR